MVLRCARVLMNRAWHSCRPSEPTSSTFSQDSSGWMVAWYTRSSHCFQRPSREHCCPPMREMCRLHGSRWLMHEGQQSVVHILLKDVPLGGSSVRDSGLSA